MDTSLNVLYVVMFLTSLIGFIVLTSISIFDLGFSFNILIYQVFGLFGMYFSGKALKQLERNRLKLLEIKGVQ
jgi:hypothetical protein